MGSSNLNKLILILFLICPLVNIVFLSGHAFFITVFKGRIEELNIGIGKPLFHKGYFSVGSIYFLDYSYKYEMVEKKLIHSILIHLGGALFNLFFILSLLISSWFGIIHINQIVLSFVEVSGILLLGTLIPYSLNGINSEGKQIYNLIRSGKTSFFVDAEKQLEHIDKVIDLYEKNNIYDDRLTKAYYEKADVLRKENRNEQAMLYLEKVIKINPMKAEAHSQKGSILLNLQKYGEALDSFLIAIEIESGNSMLYYNVACTYSLLEQVEDAIKYLTKAIELDRSCKEFAKKDTDFHNIENSTEFKRIIS